VCARRYPETKFSSPTAALLASLIATRGRVRAESERTKGHSCGNRLHSRAGATGSLLPVPPTRRFQAVKIRDCRLYAAKGW
jgi:hypothetical protein